MKMLDGFRGTVNGQPVVVAVTDLNEFFHASEDTTIFVEDDEGNPFTVAKRDLVIADGGFKVGR